MNDYDFSVLNDKEFENLTIDLISRDRGKRFERFMPGRDGGIDGRYYRDDGKEDIIQCKHYLKTGYNKLISSLQNGNNGKSEVDKVKKLNPEKYIFVTSLSLSPSRKEKIKKLFEPYIKKDSDIYGQEDLNNILKENPDIEENHYKLWISSTTVLKRIFNNAIKGRSKFLLDNIKNKIKYYIITENHNKAIEKLEDSHTIVIVGEPGIGKTTLARQIALNYISKGFEFFVITNYININEAEAIITDNKQIFYFDDFLGSNYLNALEAHQDSSIMDFIEQVKSDKNKRFVLTSRTNIFNQAISLSDTFKHQNINENEFILNINKFQYKNKKNILYNHIWHSNLEEKYKKILYQKQFDIIYHKNFNPRLIEFITNQKNIDDNTNDILYWEYIINNLNNPTEIWTNAFDKQSDEHIRSIVCLTVFNGNRIDESELRDAYNRLNLPNYFNSSKEFNSVIKDTLNFFLNRNIYIEKDKFYIFNKKKKNNTIYTLFNPSIADFIINRYIDNEAKLLLYFSSLQTINSLKLLNVLYINFKITKSVYNRITIELFKKCNLIEEQNANQFIYYPDKAIYFSKLIHMIDNNLFKNEFVIDSGKKIKLNNNEIYSYSFISILSEFSPPNLKEINNIIKLSSFLNFGKDTMTIDSLSNLITQYLKNTFKSNIEDKIDNLNYSDDIELSMDYYLIDYDGYHSDLEEFIEVSHPINKEKILDKLIEELKDSTLYDLDEYQILESIEDDFIKNRIIENARDCGCPFFDDDNDEFLY